jgi:hypothetical protein
MIIPTIYSNSIRNKIIYYVFRIKMSAYPVQSLSPQIIIPPGDNRKPLRTKHKHIREAMEGKPGLTKEEKKHYKKHKKSHSRHYAPPPSGGGMCSCGK